MTIPPPAEIQRIVYLGTPVTAVPPLRALCDAGYEIGLVVSRPDTRRARGVAFQPSPVKAAALDLGLDVSDDLEDLAEVDADLGVVVAYGEIIPPALLEQLSMVNLHFSLLPRWRGAAPVERAILAGDEVTGVSLMAIDEGLDTGAVYRLAEISIDPDEESGALRARLTTLGTGVLIEALAEGLGEPEPQTGEPVYARKITAKDRHIDWTRPAVQIHRQVRVGGAWTTFRDQQFKIWRTAVDSAHVVQELRSARVVQELRSAHVAQELRSAHVAQELRSAPVAETKRAGLPGSISGLSVATGEGRIDLLEVQAQGRTRQVALAWHNGARLSPEDRFV